MNYTEFTLRTKMRDLWVQDAMYTRLYMISIIADLSDIDTIEKRIIKNYDDISNIFKPYYGKDFSTNLKDLLKEHILTTVEFMDKTVKGKVEESIAIKQFVYDNTEKITNLLTSVNPKLPNSILREDLFTILDLAEKEFISRYYREYQEDINTFDEIRYQMTQLADVLSESIIKNFPDKFASSKSNSKFDQLLG